MLKNKQTSKKDDHPTHLKVRFDLQLTFNKYIQMILKKVQKRLDLLKRHVSTTWGSDKNTLNYFLSAMEYNSLLTTCSKPLDRMKHTCRLSLLGSVTGN